MADETGQEAGSQTAEAETGQETRVATPTTDEIVQAAQEAEDSAASETKVEAEAEPESKVESETEDEGKPAPYDQDPKWLAARAAQKNLTEVLKENNIDGVEELKDLLKTGMTLKELVGDRDADQITLDLQQAKQHRHNLKHWEEQKRIKEEENLDPDERADLYKQKLAEKETAEATKKAGEKAVEDAKAEIETFNNRVGKIIDDQGFDEGTIEIAKMLSGVDNPFNEIDISDGKAVRAMAGKNVEQLKVFIAGIQQGAIDDYVAGKSEFTPLSPTETPDKSTVETAATGSALKEGETDAEAFSRVTDEVLAIVAGVNQV